MIWVRSRNFVENIWKPVLPTAVISITTPGDPEAKIPEDEMMIAGILRLQFHDIGPEHLKFDPEGKLTLMTKDHAEEIVEFVLTMPPVACVLVHCDAGISRSAGVAAAISKVLFGDDSFFFINYLPNRHCHRLVLEEFHNRETGIHVASDFGEGVVKTD